MTYPYQSLTASVNSSKLLNNCLRIDVLTKYFFCWLLNLVKFDIFGYFCDEPKTQIFLDSVYPYIFWWYVSAKVKNEA